MKFSCFYPLIIGVLLFSIGCFSPNQEASNTKNESSALQENKNLGFLLPKNINSIVVNSESKEYALVKNINNQYSKLNKKNGDKWEVLDTTVLNFLIGSDDTIYALKKWKDKQGCLHSLQSDSLRVVSTRPAKQLLPSYDNLVYALIDLPKFKDVPHFFNGTKWEAIAGSGYSKMIALDKEHIFGIRELPAHGKVIHEWNGDKWKVATSGSVLDYMIKQNGAIYAIRSGQKFENALFKWNDKTWELIDDTHKFQSLEFSQDENVWYTTIDNRLGKI